MKAAPQTRDQALRPRDFDVARVRQDFPILNEKIPRQAAGVF
jgi:hypothetical protein